MVPAAACVCRLENFLRDAQAGGAACAEGAEAKDLGQHFITGYTSFAEVAPLAEKGLIGGIYISHHNIKGRTATALKAEIASLQELRRGAGLAPLIVAADQEGGIVSHLAPQLTSLPALSTLTDLPPDRRARMAGEFGRTHGRELADLGVTLNFAPVVDLRRSQGRNPFDFNSLISRRAISDDPTPRSRRSLRGLCCADWRRRVSARP